MSKMGISTLRSYHGAQLFEAIGLNHELIDEYFDLSPWGIIKELNLRRPIYRQVAAYGHFGRSDLDLPWERTPYRDDLARDAGLDPQLSPGSEAAS